MLESKTLKVNNKNGLIYITFPSLEISGVTAAFTTRMGGVSKGRYATMNMSFTNGDDKENVMQNYRILFSALGLEPERAVLSHQTHTDNIRIITAEDVGKGIVKERDFDDVDGMITDIKGVSLVTQYADCVPLLFYDRVKKIVAASHAGWRGTVKQIGAKTVQKMSEAFGSRPEDICAAIGPSIKKCCYEVDEPVFSAIHNIEYINDNDVLTKTDSEHWMLDLQKTNALILEHAGIKTENISVSDICTCCNSNYLHSHRATAGSRGNLAAIIALK